MLKSPEQQQQQDKTQTIRILAFQRLQGKSYLLRAENTEVLRHKNNLVLTNWIRTHVPTTVSFRGAFKSSFYQTRNFSVEIPKQHKSAW